jgi:hypothetical protein
VANLRGRWIDVAAIEVAESLMNVRSIFETAGAVRESLARRPP